MMTGATAEHQAASCSSAAVATATGSSGSRDERRAGVVGRCLEAALAARTMARLVLAEHLEPGAEIVGVAHRRHDAEQGAHEGAGHFGDQLFLGIQRRAEHARHVASQT